MIYLINYEYSKVHSQYDYVSINVMNDYTEMIEIPDKLFLYDRTNNYLDKSSIHKEINMISYGINEIYTEYIPKWYSSYSIILPSMKFISINLSFNYGKYPLDNLDYYIIENTVIVRVPGNFHKNNDFSDRDNISLDDDSRSLLDRYVFSIINNDNEYKINITNSLLFANSSSTKSIIPDT